jgi:hypothetical protein
MMLLVKMLLIKAALSMDWLLGMREGQWLLALQSLAL